MKGIITDFFDRILNLNCYACHFGIHPSNGSDVVDELVNVSWVHSTTIAVGRVDSNCQWWQLHCRDHAVLRQKVQTGLHGLHQLLRLLVQEPLHSIQHVTRKCHDVRRSEAVVRCELYFLKICKHV